MNRILIIIFSVLLLSGCLFDNSQSQYDNTSVGVLTIYNYSDSAIYVYMKCGVVDSLPLNPKLELFVESIEEITDKCGNIIFQPIVAPEYRINAFKHDNIRVGGNSDAPKLPCNEHDITLFFITEKTMHDHNWEQIYKGQMYIERVTFTEEELNRLCWRYSYISPELRQDTIAIPFYGRINEDFNQSLIIRN